MRFGSVCSGIEAASVAWNPLGWKAAWLAEIEPFPSAVLAHHYPDVPNLGDMTKLAGRILNGEIEAPDVFCGGTPCQAFSVAGLRKSLDDARGNLSLTFCEIANVIDNARSFRGLDPAIVFWENVPGVLNTKDNAFGCFLGALAGEDGALEPPGGKWAYAGVVSGPQRTIAWRTLDAQYFGVAQRRRRVFVVASARPGFDPVKVLFEFDGVRRDTAPSRETGQGTARGIEIGPGGGRFTDLNPTLDTRAKDGPIRNQLAGAVMQPAVDVCPTLRDGGNSTGGDRPPGTDVDTADSLVIQQPYAVGNTLTARMAKGINSTLDEGRTPVLALATTQYGDIAGALTARHDSSPCADRGQNVVVQPVAGALCKDSFTGGMGGRPEGVVAPAIAWDEELNASIDVSGTLLRGGQGGRRDGVPSAMQVRRLTPVECERLQGFPDFYTAIPWRKKPAEDCPDGPRYKALGNSWAVPVVRWIGQRIDTAVNQ
jgi:DNA (cytosine-5)-methyltransferase 1